MSLGNKKLRYGIIGSGMMGREHIRNLLAIDNCEVVAISDTNAPSRAKSVELINGAVQFSDHREMLSTQDLDVVIIATPNHTHLDLLNDVLETGLHVLVEKPLCTTVDDCLLAIDRDRQTHRDGRVVWVGLEYRYMAPTARLLSEVNLGTCGKVQMVAIREHRFPFLEKIDNWNRFTSNTGGTLVEKCCHFFDVMGLIAQSRAVRVFASGDQDVNHLDETYDGKRSDILDNAFVIVDYQNGVRGMLDLSMFAEGSKNEQEISVVGSNAKLEALITESKIRIGLRVNGATGVEEIVVEQPRGVVAGFHAGASYLEHLAMQRAIRTGQPSLVTLQDGLNSVAVGQAAHLSIVQKRVVEISELFI
ncbi:MAG: Gfo/Idh/MocA family oxidoreductase [Actinobacteria bacterium]|nr:Gfo/Idh/MocA family oxidoreductase [Actinomycetota bacterium]